LANVHRELAEILDRENMLDDAEGHYKVAFEYFQQSDAPQKEQPMALCIYGLAGIAWKKRDLTHADQLYDQAAKSTELAYGKESSSHGNVLWSHGRLLVELNRLPEAKARLLTAVMALGTSKSPLTTKASEDLLVVLTKLKALDDEKQRQLEAEELAKYPAPTAKKGKTEIDVLKRAREIEYRRTINDAKRKRQAEEAANAKLYEQMRASANAAVAARTETSEPPSLPALPVLPEPLPALPVLPELIANEPLPPASPSTTTNSASNKP